MPIRKKLAQLLSIANSFYRKGFRRIRFNFLTIGFEFPVDADLIWLGAEKQPLLAAKLTGGRAAPGDALEFFSVAVTPKGNYKLCFQQSIALDKAVAEDYLPEIMSNKKTPIGDALFDARLLIPDAGDMTKLAALFKLKDSSRNGIMDNFSCLALAAMEKNAQPADNSPDFQAAVEHFDGGDNRWRALAEYIIHYLSDYDLAHIPPEGLAELLDLSPKEREWLLYYDFANALVGDSQNVRITHIPFMGDGIYAYSFGRLYRPFLISGFVSTPTEKRWVDTLLTLAGCLHEVEVKEPEEVIVASPVSAGYVFLIPPYEIYVHDIARLIDFKVYQLTSRKKEKLETLALEYCLNAMEPGGTLFALLSHSFITITTYHSFRQYLLEKAEVRAIVSFPPGAMQKRWGYQLDFLYLQKKGPKVQQKDTYLSKLTEFSPIVLRQTAEGIRGGDGDD